MAIADIKFNGGNIDILNFLNLIKRISTKN
jgi:hypothetical protein